MFEDKLNLSEYVQNLKFVSQAFRQIFAYIACK